MKVEIPEDWKGNFFDIEEAQHIIKMTAEEFILSLTEGQPSDAEFFLAGAIFDLYWNGLSEKAAELIIVASEKFNAPYRQIPVIIKLSKEEIATGKNEGDIKTMLYALIGAIFKDCVGAFIILDLSSHSIGMSCDEFTTLVIAGPLRKDLPPSIQDLVKLHEISCIYHRSPAFNQSALRTPVTGKLEQAAKEIIEKYIN